VQLARAHRLQKLLDDGKAKSRREIAKLAGVTPARVTQLLDLLFLAPDIQAEILFLEVPPGEQPISERRLR